MLVAWPQVASPGELQFWVGAFDAAPPPDLAFEVGGQAVVPIVAPTWFAIRDRRTAPSGAPINHQCIVRLPAAGPDQAHRVAISGGGQRVERVVFAPPASVPFKLDGSFNILLVSCYFQPNDRSARLGTIVSGLPVRPHMTLLAGDQVYLDLPLFEDLPEREPGLSQWLGDKYRRNWLSTRLGTAGLAPVLERAPALCIPDDHEFWNNFPFKQAQLPGTWTPAGREAWRRAAQALYEDYQQGGAPGTAPAFRRIDVDPLCMLFIDTRCRRAEDFDAEEGLMPLQAQQAIETWKAELIDMHKAGRTAAGLLAAGQALFVPRPGSGASRLADAELANYRQAACIDRALGDLAAAGIPTVFATGDVHWGRVAEAMHVPSGRPMLYEVICSPSRLIDSPGSDQKALIADRLQGLFGRRQTWPRHSDPPNPPERWGRTNEFEPRKVFGLRGDQVALMQFTRAGRGLEMRVTYYPIHDDPKVAQPLEAPVVNLLPL